MIAMFTHGGGGIHTGNPTLKWLGYSMRIEALGMEEATKAETEGKASQGTLDGESEERKEKWEDEDEDEIRE